MAQLRTRSGLSVVLSVILALLMAKSARGDAGGGGEAAARRGRMKRLRSALARERCDSLLITYPNDIRYLTGFSGEASCAVVTARELFIISDFRFEEELEPLRKNASVIMRKGQMPEAQAELLRKLKPRALAVQAEHMTIEGRRAIAKAAGERRLREPSGLLAGLRAVKDETEIASIRAAVKIQQDAMVATLKTVRAGQTEAEVGARLEFEARQRGAEAMSFDTIVAAKANGSKPHYRAGKVKLAKGSPLLIDWGVKVNGYCADMTRTFSLGKWPPKMREIYGLVLEAHMAAIDAVRPGITCKELDGVARGIIERAGYGERFGHGLGHGIGLDIHEGPRVFKASKTRLEPGMVITIEPGVYLPGIGGVRIEDDILVTERGGRNLCTLAKDLKWATLHG